MARLSDETIRLNALDRAIAINGQGTSSDQIVKDAKNLENYLRGNA